MSGCWVWAIRPGYRRRSEALRVLDVVVWMEGKHAQRAALASPHREVSKRLAGTAQGKAITRSRRSPAASESLSPVWPGGSRSPTVTKGDTAAARTALQPVICSLARFESDHGGGPDVAVVQQSELPERVVG